MKKILLFIIITLIFTSCIPAALPDGPSYINGSVDQVYPEVIQAINTDPSNWLITSSDQDSGVIAAEKEERLCTARGFLFLCTRYETTILKFSVVLSQAGAVETSITVKGTRSATSLKLYENVRTRLNNTFGSNIGIDPNL